MPVVGASKPPSSTGGPLPGTSFKAPDPPKNRLIMSLEGLEKQGKTHFALTAPGPLAIQSIDLGTEGVVEKFLPHKQVMVAGYRLKLPTKATPLDVTVVAEQVWDQFLVDYKAVLASGVRTVVWDTATELWELLRMARFGRLAQVMPHNYAPVNAEFRELIRLAYDSPVNLLALHKQKSEWVNDAGGKGNKTGKYIRSGFSDIGFMVQLNAEAFREEDGTFHVKVKDCRQNPGVAGADLMGPMCDFPTLAEQVFPETTEKDWI